MFSSAYVGLKEGIAQSPVKNSFALLVSLVGVNVRTTEQVLMLTSPVLDLLPLLSHLPCILSPAQCIPRSTPLQVFPYPHSENHVERRRAFMEI